MTRHDADPDRDWDDSMLTEPDTVDQAKAGHHREPPRRVRATDPDSDAEGRGVVDDGTDDGVAGSDEPSGGPDADR